MQTAELKEKLLSGLFDEKLESIYVDRDLLKEQAQRYADALDRFSGFFEKDEAAVFSAPGRIEVIGNHTDHQHGKVIAASVNRDIIAVAAKRYDRIVRIISEDTAWIDINLDELEPALEEEKTPSSLVKGILKGIEDTGYALGGFEAYATSQVPVGSGLSSSAAFEILIVKIVSAFFNNDSISPKEAALIGQFAENVYFGKPCGLMDQTACSVGNLVYIDFANPAEPAIEKLDFDLAALGYSICVTETGDSHADLVGEYAAIPAEMKCIAQALGENFLNDVKRSDFEAAIPVLRESCSDRAILRAIHFYDENERVAAQVKAVKHGHFGKFLKLENESGISSFTYLQNVYADTKEKSESLALALALSDRILAGTGASRVHGGGFAGTIIAFVPDEKSAKYKKQMDDVFRKDACNILKIRSLGGTQVF